MEMSLILTTLLLLLEGNNTHAGASVTTDPNCYSGLCVSLSGGEITGQAGLCAVLPCFFSTQDGFEVKSLIWYKCLSQKMCKAVIFNSTRNRSGDVKGRVSLLELDLTNNCSIIINNLKESDSGYYHLRLNGIRKADKQEVSFTPITAVPIKVLLTLTQTPTVEVPALTEGQQSTLTCTAPALCSGSDPNITWTWRPAGGKDSDITGSITTAHGRSSSLTFTPSAKHHGTEVTCKVNFRGSESTQETVTLNVTLTDSLKILNISSCEKSVGSKVMTCMCISEGFPLPTIRWPLLEKQSEYSVITTVSNHTINSTVSLRWKHLSGSRTVECVSRNERREVKSVLGVSDAKPDQRYLLKLLFRTVQEPQVILSFLMGLILSASICCVARLCRRKKTKKHGNLYETLEMVTAPTVRLIDAEQQVEDNPTHGPEEMERHGAEASGTWAHDSDVKGKQVEYSDLDFSVLTRQRPADAEQAQAGTEPEYAEIKRQITEDTQGTKEEGEEDQEEEEAVAMEEVMSGEEQENKQCVFIEEEQGGDVAVYSNLEEIINDI